MSHAPTWGVVATIKAPTRDILDFAAHHLDLGAHRVFIYLDAPDPGAQAALRAHPKCRVTLCDDAYWARRRRRGRPEQHQPRQSLNATHCLNRRPQVDWLAHVDVDEFLWPSRRCPINWPPCPPRLSAPASARSRRWPPIRATRPCRGAMVQVLRPASGAPPRGDRRDLSRFRSASERRLRQPCRGQGLRAHRAGGLSLRIHNAFQGGVKDDAPETLPDTWLCHLHAATWDHWHARYRFRLRRGSYRPGLKPAPLAEGGAPNMHALFRDLEEAGGEAALRRFFAEVCTATPGLRARLAAHGRLHAMALDLDAKRARHFPGCM